MTLERTLLYERVSVHFENGSRSLRALKRFRQGECIIDIPQTTQHEPDMYSIEVSPGIHVDCSQSQVGAINHSCEPNAAVKKNVIIAWSCIEPGDEIRIDYKKTEQKLAVPFDCDCGSKNCIGRIE